MDWCGKVAALISMTSICLFSVCADITFPRRQVCGDGYNGHCDPDRKRGLWG